MTKTLTLRLDSYDAEAKQLVAGAQELADKRKHSEVEPIHLLFLLVDHAGLAQETIEKSGVDPSDVLVESEWVLRKLKPANGAGEAYLSPRFLDLLTRAEGEAARDNGAAVSTRHLLIACAQESTGGVRTTLRASGLSAPVLRTTLTELGTAPAEQPKTGGDPLEQFGRDLTRLAAQGHFDPTIGRDAELRRMLQVLARRQENNPLLVGEPGIGKTAIVQALASRIARGDVPAMLDGKRLVSLDGATMIAGAKLRGQLEERMRSVLNTIRDSGGQVILFLPSLQPFLQAKGSAQELLATAISRDEVRTIAVATPDQLRQAADEDSALFRRFVPIQVDPPTVDQAIAILRGVVRRFEAAHGVHIVDPALVAAVNFARRYIPAIELPKSAIDLIDESAAQVRIEMESVPAALDSLQRRLEAVEIQCASLQNDKDADSLHARKKLEAESASLKPRIEEMRTAWKETLAAAADVRRLQEELIAAEREFEQSKAAGDDDRAAEIRTRTIPKLEAELSAATQQQTEVSGGAVHDTVTPEDIAEVVALWTGVPVAKMLEEEASKLLQMEERLRTRVVGQDHAITALSKAVRRGRTGLRDPKKPIGSFLFLGPTGVGKTELAKALAEFLFDDEASLTRLDMSEFMEKHMVARLLGSPPGYVDSESGGFLTEAVRQRPYSVVLFDEMEKAHPDVFNIMLQVLDDGRLSDSRGRVARFNDTVIIMTSNVGSDRILDHAGNKDELEAIIEDELHNYFRPEFLNRVDDVLIFNALGKPELRLIVDIQLRRLQKMLEIRRLKLEVSDAAKDQLVELGYEPAFGARPLQRVIVKNLQDPLAEALLRGGFGAGDTVLVDYVAEFTFSKA